MNGTLSALPNMTRGTVHAYFYFGDQKPQASLQLANDLWSGSKVVDFIFDSVGDGWYYGSVPTGLLQGYESGNGSKIIRILVSVPAGYNVYIDGLMHYSNEVNRMKARGTDKTWLTLLTLLAFYCYGLVLVLLKTPQWQSTYPIQLCLWLS